MNTFNEQVITWESAFTQYIDGLNNKDTQMIDEALKVMNSIDQELTSAIWNEDIMEVRKWRQENNMIEDIKHGRLVRTKDYNQAVCMLEIVRRKGIEARIKNYFGKYYSIEI